jgi:hypothetical protein
MSTTAIAQDAIEVVAFAPASDAPVEKALSQAPPNSAELIGPDGFRQSLADGGFMTRARSGPHALIVAGSPESSLIEDYDLIVEPSTQ